jgi:NTP pyrophosphatase (non-canonical NTP hydrolase)
MTVKVTITDPEGTELSEWKRDDEGNLILPLSFEDLREKNATRVQRWHPEGSVPWTGADWMTATAGEMGEAANIVKKLRRADTGARNDDDPEVPMLLAALADELADTAIYLDLLALHYGINLDAAISSKFNRTSEKYGFPERLFS